MPSYAYDCAKCAAVIEVFQGINEPVLERCPYCGGNGLKRRIGAGSGVIFKGTGFYCTDYRSGGSADESKKENIRHDD